jgi:hypothetical protein
MSCSGRSRNKTYLPVPAVRGGAGGAPTRRRVLHRSRLTATDWPHQGQRRALKTAGNRPDWAGFRRPGPRVGNLSLPARPMPPATGPSPGGGSGPVPPCASGPRRCIFFQPPCLGLSVTVTKTLCRPWPAWRRRNRSVGGADCPPAHLWHSLRYNFGHGLQAFHGWRKSV